MAGRTRGAGAAKRRADRRARSERGVSKALAAAKLDGLTAGTETVEKSSEAIAFEVMRDRLQHTASCECGHSYSDHLGADGPCTYEDGRGTCSCSGFAELALVAAAGDLLWGPEDGFQDVLSDVNEILRSMDVYGYVAVDVTTKLDKVLVSDWDGDECWSIPITIGADREPVLSDQSEWLPVEPGWVEVAQNEEYAARIAAARDAAPRGDASSEQIAVARMSLQFRSLRAAGVELLPEHQPGETLPDTHTSPEAPELPRGPLEWDAIFVPEGKLTSDGRCMAPGSIFWRNLPLTLMGMVETAEGHDGAQVCGKITKIWRDETAGLIRATGEFDVGDFGQEIARMVASQVLTGVSVDLAIHQWEVGPVSDYFDEDGNWTPKDTSALEEPSLVELLFGDPDEQTIYVVTKGEIGASTVCPFPAFAEASIEAASALAAGGSPLVWTVKGQAGFRVLVRAVPKGTHEVGGHPVRVRPDSLDGGFVASVLDLPGVGSQGETEEEVLSNVAEAILLVEQANVITAAAEGLTPEVPPAEWFANPELEGPTALVVEDDGRIYGHAALWDSCHIGFADTCVSPPASESDYSYFLLGEVACDDGARVPVGQITLGTGHAGLNLGRAAAVAHYDDTGLCAADVTVGEDEHGIWFAGAIRPNVEAARVRELRAAKLSGDWRRVDDGPLELVALLAVNVPGFPVPRHPRAVVASGDDGNQVLALVAAGIQGTISKDDRDRLQELRVLATGEKLVRAEPSADEE